MSRTVDILTHDASSVVSRINLSDIKGKSFLLTGASGLIGTCFLTCLKEAGRLGYGPSAVYAIIQSDPRHYFRTIADESFIHLFQGDITNHSFCNRLPMADYIIHAAGHGQPGRFMADPIRTLHLNTSTMLTLFERLNAEGRFLFVSTAEVYSGLQTSPHRESEIGTTNTTHPRSCYIEAKRGGEAICNAWRSRGVKAKAARLALAYGPGVREGDTRALNSFIEQGLKGKISLMDDGSAWRTYCYITDAVEIMWRILFDGCDLIYNVGGKSRTTIANLAKMIGRMLDVPVIFPEKTKALVGAPSDVKLDMAKVENEFSKAEYVEFEMGLKNTIEWQKAFRELN